MHGFIDGFKKKLILDDWLNWIDKNQWITVFWSHEIVKMECFSYVHCYIEQCFDEIFSTFYQSIHTASKAIGGFRGFKLLGFLVELIGIMIVWSLMMNFCKWITFPMFIVLLLHFFHEICTTFLELINTAIRSIDGF